MKTANASGGNQSWTFDSNGNRKTHVWGGSTDTYSPETYSNRIDQISGTRARSYNHDDGGNRESESDWRGAYSYSYSYDALNRLKTAVSGTFREVTYAKKGLSCGL